MKHINKQSNQPYKVLWFGDLVAPSGFGRIGNEVTKRLAQRGYAIQGASINYTGWPHDFPFHVWPLGGQDIWNGLVGITNAYQPDIIISCQDFPYHQTIWNACRIDFSRIKWMFITPIDGTPVHPDWVRLCDFADGKMVISRFGVEALRQAGKRVELCHPGVDTSEFYPVTDDERKSLREKAGYTADDYVIGVVCMNQGRKAIPPMIEAFHEFAKDKPNARLFLDMDKTSAAGWDIPALLKQMAWTDDEQKRIKFREDVFKSDMAAFAPLRNRYGLMDAHMVISHREGFGLPLQESMACKVPTLALDWCSGTELCSGGRGMLVKRIPYMEHGTWGGARDAFPNMKDLIAKLDSLYYNQAQRNLVAETGYNFAIKQTWDVTTDQVENVLQAALRRERSQEPNADNHFTNPAPGLSDTYGPATTPDALGHHPVIQQPVRAPEMHAEPVRDLPRDGAGGDAGDISAG